MGGSSKLTTRFGLSRLPLRARFGVCLGVVSAALWLLAWVGILGARSVPAQAAMVVWAAIFNAGIIALTIWLTRSIRAPIRAMSDQLQTHTVTGARGINRVQVVPGSEIEDLQRLFNRLVDEARLAPPEA